MSDRPKIIVLDDDPTGSQTVHSCLLLLKWDVATLKQGLLDRSPIFFVLTNTRARPAAEAKRVTQEVCLNLKLAIAATHTATFLVVSRSDSTLRGHYPVETDAIAAELGPFDAHFMVPAFFAAGRVTIDSTHYIDMGGQRTPVHETEFAQDSAFGYHHSYLPDYVAEKTQGRIAANQVCCLTLADLRVSEPNIPELNIPEPNIPEPKTLEPKTPELENPKLRSPESASEGPNAEANDGPKTPLVTWLMGLSGDTCVAVDAEIQSDLDQFSRAVLAAAAGGKRFLFRSAASLLTSLAQLPPQPVLSEAMSAKALSGGRRGERPGVVLVGSHVQKTTQQLTELLKLEDVTGIEVDVAQLRDSFEHVGPDFDGGGSAVTSVFESLRQEISAQVQQVYDQGQTPVVYTSRQELAFATTEARLAFGVMVSALLMAIVHHLPPEIGFLISKGGITSNDTLSQGLELTQVRLLGQIIPGVSVVKTEATHPQFPHLPVVLFPGNVGDAEGVAVAYRRLRPTRSTPI